jgi:hypothetical protein
MSARHSLNTVGVACQEALLLLAPLPVGLTLLLLLLLLSSAAGG